ncbi:MAG: hypothetical protein ACSHX0_13975 [Akkermansiaceae bacterium]
MNTVKYIAARLGISLGVSFKKKWLTAAADESHLLQQAEELLGYDLWRHVEDLEEISTEYWSLRQLELKRNKLQKMMDEAIENLEKTQGARSQLLNETNDGNISHEEKRDELKDELKKVMKSRDDVIGQAKQIKRSMDASKAKIEVLSEDQINETVVQQEKQKVGAYQEKLLTLKAKRDKVALTIKGLNQKLSDIENIITAERKNLRDKASSVYQGIGKVNRDISQLSSEVGLIDIEIKKNCTRIGRYLSVHTSNDKCCAEICAKSTGLVGSCQNLRASIALNHKLAALAGD